MDPQADEADPPAASAGLVGSETEELATSDDRLMESEVALEADAELAAAASYASSDDLLARLLLGSDDAEDAAVPATPSPPASPVTDDAVTVKMEQIDDWPVFDEPLDDALDSHFDDHFLLFPQLVM